MMQREPREVKELYSGVKQALDTVCDNGRRVGDCKDGVYLFYDYDGEPIYVGQTSEGLRIRIRRHLTNQRTDAVAMSVLDPFEVAEIEMWPFWDLTGDVKESLNRAEFTVYEQALQKSRFGVVLNEREVVPAEITTLPPSIRTSILSDELRQQREHPDIRLARRARALADLARRISERRVKVGIRRALLAQAKRLEWLAQIRLDEIENR